MEALKIIDHVYWHQKEEFLLAQDTDSFWVLYLIKAGSCRYQIEEKSGLISGPTALLCPPNVMFIREVVEPLSFHFFRLDIDLTAHFITRQAGEIGCNQERLKMNEVLLKEYVFDLSAFSFLIRSHLVLDLFLYHQGNNSQQIGSYAMQQIRNKSVLKVIDYLEEHFAEEIKIEKLAAAYNFNVSYFSRLFKKETGSSPKDYLITIRLKKVQQLLIATALPMDEIAELSGFKHGDYLSKYFKKTFSISPSEFRKKHRI